MMPRNLTFLGLGMSSSSRIPAHTHTIVDQKRTKEIVAVDGRCLVVVEQLLKEGREVLQVLLRPHTLELLGAANVGRLWLLIVGGRWRSSCRCAVVTNYPAR